MGFSEEYKKILNPIQKDLNEIENRITQSIKLSCAIDDLLRNFLTQRAKRVRPVLSLLYLRANNINPTDAHYDFLTAIEIIHNASLIHDDVIDESDTRRDSETLNSKFNNKIAILTGDYLLTNALNFLNKLNSPEIISTCSNTLSEMCQGEVEQYFNRFKITSIENYLKKTEQKTAKLFQTAVEGAVILCKDCGRKNAANLGYNFGMAFQIRDDLLNISGTDKTKPFQNDITHGIYNAPIIFAGQTENLSTGFAKTETLLNNYIINAENSIKYLEENIYKQSLKKLLRTLK